MNKKQWLVVYTPVGQPNIVAGPFTDGITAIAFVSEDFNYTATSVYDNLDDALKDDSKMMFVPGCEG